MLNSNPPPFPTGEPAFVAELREHTSFTPNWGKLPDKAPARHLDTRKGLFLKSACPDALLETAFFDLQRFWKESSLAGNVIPVTVQITKKLTRREQFRTTISDEGIRIEASDTEGARRAIYNLEDRLTASPLLPFGTKTCAPWLKNRISRCFFAPIKRAPFFKDELMSDIDYYPDEFLSRLAHDGINGLWLTVAFREVCTTSLLGTHPDAARRLNKLRQTVEKCRRYGIGVWCFCIEPICWRPADNPCPPEGAACKGPGFMYAECLEEWNIFCVRSEQARQYLYECSNFLFKAVPHLAGLIDINYGERPTSCISLRNVRKPFGQICPDCKLSAGELYHRMMQPLLQGMHDANPDASIISWFYVPSETKVDDWIFTLPKHAPKELQIAFNFESGSIKNQLGRRRFGGDYWLSATKPAKRFEEFARACQGHCIPVAKLQVVCSHEQATVPYIPVPGLNYMKYRLMKRLGVQSVIQCWFFGNYPGMMNWSATHLGFEEFLDTKKEYLLRIARETWGKDAPAVAQAWEHFAKAYQNYPMDNMVQYYGPMHDGIVWPLHLRLRASSLTRSWLPDNEPAGDGIGEMLWQFNLHELVQLTERMATEWEEGLALLPKTRNPILRKEVTICEALALLFRSSYHILSFYEIRNSILRNGGGAAELKQLEEIVRKELTATRRMVRLCQEDTRLGYHSEAAVMKYHPEKLRWRIRRLQALLKHEFPKAYSLATKPESLQEYLFNRSQVAQAGRAYGSNGIRWRFHVTRNQVTIDIRFLAPRGRSEKAYLFLMDELCENAPKAPRVVSREQGTETDDGWMTTLRIPRKEFPGTFLRFGIERIYANPDGSQHFDNDLPGTFSHSVRLRYLYFMVEKMRLLALF